MENSFQEIDAYLHDVKNAVQERRYRLDLNVRRLDNQALFSDYVINMQDVEKILLSLSPWDFSEAVQNRHEGFEDEMLFIFGKTVRLLQRYGQREGNVPLYIKINKIMDGFVIIISFHKQRRRLNFYFEHIHEKESGQ